MDHGSHVLASSLAALIARLVTHPLDTVKVHLQMSSTRSSVGQLLSFWNSVKSIYHMAGMKGFYDGLFISLLFCIPALAVYLTFYDAAKNILSLYTRWAPAVIHLTAGGLAELISNCFWCPMEVIKTRQQTLLLDTSLYQYEHSTPRMPRMPSTDNLLSPPSNVNEQDTQAMIPKTREPLFIDTSILSVVKDIYSSYGFTGFYRGFYIGMLVYIPHSCVFFVCYEYIKSLAVYHQYGPDSDHLPLEMYCCASALAASAACCVSNIFDVLKTRYQAQRTEECVLDHTHEEEESILTASTERMENIALRHPNPVSRTDSSLSLLMQFYRVEGWRLFICGLLGRIFFMVPNVVLSFTIYEGIKSHLLHNYYLS